eukprot:m.80808 g.80808  ORF g.80808 m.80808 type:complete len:538 (+) comp10939_c0_seq2:1603-3216(+)
MASAAPDAGAAAVTPVEREETSDVVDMILDGSSSSSSDESSFPDTEDSTVPSVKPPKDSLPTTSNLGLNQTHARSGDHTAVKSNFVLGKFGKQSSTAVAPSAHREYPVKAARKMAPTVDPAISHRKYKKGTYREGNGPREHPLATKTPRTAVPASAQRESKKALRKVMVKKERLTQTKAARKTVPTAASGNSSKKSGSEGKVSPNLGLAPRATTGKLTPIESPLILHKFEKLGSRDNPEPTTIAIALDELNCSVCQCDDNEEFLLLCDSCNSGYHTHCLTPPLATVPDTEWYCDACAKWWAENGSAPRVKSTSSYAPWSAEEDAKLQKLMGRTHEVCTWKERAKHFPGRNASAVNNRWRMLKSDVKRKPETSGLAVADMLPPEKPRARKEKRKSTDDGSKSVPARAKPGSQSPPTATVADTRGSKRHKAVTIDPDAEPWEALVAIIHPQNGLEMATTKELRTALEALPNAAREMQESIELEWEQKLQAQKVALEEQAEKLLREQREQFMQSREDVRIPILEACDALKRFADTHLAPF